MLTTSKNSIDDAELNEPFIWKKKLDKEGLFNVKSEDIEKIIKKRIRKNQIELAESKSERLKHEVRREQLKEEKEGLRRSIEAEYHHQWDQQENTFRYNQIRLRSKIRINDGRAKPIDLLAHYISDDDDDDDDDNSAVEIYEPTSYLNGLTIRDLEDLLEDIRVYTQLEEQEKLHQYDKQYWRDITTITEDKLRKLSSQVYSDRREGINSIVFQNINEIFQNKTLQQLEQLEQEVQLKIESDTGIDIGYWESLLAQLQVHLAHAHLHERHQLTLKRKLHRIKQEQRIFHASTSVVSADKNNDEIESFEDLEIQCVRDYERGCFSPILFQINDLNLDDQKRCTDEKDDWQKLKQQRESVLKSGCVKPDGEDAFEAFARNMGSLTGDDSVINTVVQMDVQYLWSDKYRPRKPRVFNKVHTGYDWNQYNKKHYDTDNPPPKTVQGYKFNIFYPDLIDNTKTPSYSLTVCEDNREFSILKFHGGPPYEDIAFKILSNEWDYSHKHGFRCQFQNGIFQLWFHFRRWRYRR